MKNYLFGSLIVSFLIGFIITLQWKSELPSQSSYPLDQLEAQRELLKIFVDEQQKLENEVSDLRNEVETAQQTLPTYQKEQDYRKFLQEKIGLLPVADEGVEVFLSDSPLVNRNTLEVNPEGFIHASDLRDVLNLLFSSGATAVSVNSRRILPLHAVNIVGNTFLINDVYTFPPFTILATGPQDILLSRLKDETLLPDLHRRSKEKRLRFSYQRRNDLQIPAYQGPLRNDFLFPATVASDE